jgi:sugar transferase (PEP-CTERM/EpsH1 system associated)
MNILFLTHRVPYPPDKGDRIRSYHLIQHLARRHNLHLACLAWSQEEVEAAGALRDVCRSVEVARLSAVRSRWHSLTGLLTGGPLTVPYFASRNLHRSIRRRCEQHPIDLVMAFSSSMAQFVPPLRGVGRIIDFADVDSDKWMQYARHSNLPRSLIYALEGRRLRDYEREVAAHFDCCLVISDAEARLFRSFCPECRLRVVPNGVDLEYFRPQGRPLEGKELLFVGVMDYQANVDGVLHFCKEILPRIRRQVPATTFTIVGGRPAPAVRRLARLEGISVVGYVRDVRPYLRRATACVVPLRIARGVQNKILEAMASGLPVVTTRRALEGIRAQADRDILVAGDVESFARRTADLLRDRALRDRLARNARALVEEHYRWERCLRPLDEAIAENARRPSGPWPFPPEAVWSQAPEGKGRR